MNKNIIVAIVVVVAIIGSVYYFTKSSSVTPVVIDTATTTDATASSTSQTGTTTENIGETVIGTSVEKNDITAYHYGTGDTELLFVGGIHGGYEWNTTLVAYELMDYLKANPEIIPKNIKVTVLPVLNTDGLKKVVGAIGRFTSADVSTSEETVIDGRFNANSVDLNRNFDCNWQAKGTWQKMTVSGGSEAFSEPESLAIKNYIATNKPKAVVVWYSSAGGVYSSKCTGEILSETKTLTDTYAEASGYKAYDSFDFYETTGDMVNWLAKEKIPAISVLLTNHKDTEWDKNLAGIQALLKYYTK